MIWRVEVKEKEGFFDAIGHSVKKDIQELGFGKRIADVKTSQVYYLSGDLSESQVTRICEDLLIDPVTQIYSFKGTVANDAGYKVVEIAHNPGVMDPVEESAKKAILDLGIKDICGVRTAKKYLLKGKLSSREIASIAEKLLYNKLIQHIVKDPSHIFSEPPPYQFKLTEVDLAGASDDKLKKISRDGQLFLSLDEMRTIKEYFRHRGRNPTDCELETIAQTWSEHCKHKTFRGLIDFEGETINNLLKSTVMKVTKELDKSWCVSVFQDNSGVIRFDENNDVCFKVETHNHPSALEPYGGAGTGIGGVIRDILGTGLGAKPIMNTDIFCFAPPDHPHNKVPKGVMHPRRIMKGVVSGVRDYGNRMGIPTANGAVLFDKDFLGNPLVFCGTVGIMPKEKAFKKANKGDLVVVVGGRTGRDGIHGATFSSGELTTESEEVSGSCVQIGNPIQEKKVTDTLIKARDLELYTAITDCGAGGLSSAVGEMGEELGVEVELEKVPLKYKGLSHDEIWISEAQERMVLSVDPKKIDELKRVFEEEDVEVTVIGTFTGTKHLKVYYGGQLVCDVDMEFLHNGLPPVKRKATWKKTSFKEPALPKTKDLTQALLKVMSCWNVASKEWIIRQYDHEVQAGTVVKPLQGIKEDGPGDAAVITPVLGSKKGLVISCGINIDYGKIDPYWMAASAIDEALRQVTAVGGDIDKAAILDNFCWGNTNKPDRLGGLVRASRACYDIAKAYHVPFISGKDSLNNEYATGRKTISIPPTLLISCIAVMDDVSKAITMDVKEPGNPIYIVGLTHDELGGSQYYKMQGFVGNNVPKVEATGGKHIMSTLASAIGRGLIDSCHDCSDGGMATALAEMAFSGGLGLKIHLGGFALPHGQKLLPNHILLFSESNTRFIVEVSDEEEFIRAMKGVPIWKLGHVSRDERFTILDAGKKAIIDTNIETLKIAWQGPFKEM